MKRKFNDKEKWCNHCEKWLPLTSFGVLRTHPSGRTPYCKECTPKVHHRTHPKAAEYKRKHRYGLSNEEYTSLYQKQDGRCAICRQRKKLCVDHEHATGKVRGLLCRSCNTLVGQIENHPDIVDKATGYIKEFND